MDSKYVQPEYYKESFSCPHCQAFSHQIWSDMYRRYRNPVSNENVTQAVEHFYVSQCYTCKQYALWQVISAQSKVIIYPLNLSYIPKPNPDLSEEIKTDYLEAGKILRDSPRGTAALLRLCVQKLVNSLEPGSSNLNQKINKLVKKGLDTEIQRALDLARVIGNEAVHPGLLDLKDDIETARLLLDTINLIAEKLISLPKRIKKAYEKLPPNKLDEIKKRDGK